MIDVTTELLSRYADSEATPAEAEAVERAVAGDPALAAQLEEFVNLGELFAPRSPEPVSEALTERLVALGRTEPLSRFEVVPGTVRRETPWWSRAAAVAAVILVVIGIRQLTHRPQLVLSGFTRQLVDASGTVLDTLRAPGTVTMRVGDTLRAGAGERVSCRLPGGALVVLLEGAELTLGDPDDRELFELDSGTALCSVVERHKPRFVRAADYVITADQANFGVRLREPGIRPAGPALAAGPDAELTVAVSRGSLKVRDSGREETVRAGTRVVLRRGAPVVRSEVWRDSLYAELLRNLRVTAHELLPGYFTVEQGVVPIPLRSWQRREDEAYVLVLPSDEGAASAHYLVLQARTTRPTPLRLTRVRPFRDAPGEAEETTIETAVVGTDWTVVAVPRTAFDRPEAGRAVERKIRKIPAGRRLIRLELRPASTDAELELKASLWAPRPPAGLSEEIR